MCIGFIEIVRGVPLITVLFMASLMFPLFMPEGVTINKFLRAQIGMILFLRRLCRGNRAGWITGNPARAI